MVFNQLTHVSLSVTDLDFRNFEEFTRDHFSHVLRMSSTDTQHSYLDGSDSYGNLPVFDFLV